jgi:MFS family permease
MPGLGPSFQRLFAASTTSNLADGVVLIGAPLVAIGFTRDPTAIAAVQVAVTAPWLLLTLHVGALADRRDRKQLMVAASIVRATVLLVIGMLAWTGALTLPLLLFGLLLFGIGEVAFDTTSQTILPSLVQPDQLGAANGRLVGAQTVMNNFVGGPLAGVLVGLLVASVFLAPAGLYLLAAALMVRLPGSYQPATRSPATVRADIAEGLRFLGRHRALRSLAAMGAALNLANAAYFSVFVLFVVGPESPMGLPAAAYGLLAAALAVGAVGGSLIAAKLEARFGPRRVVIFGLAGGAAFMGVPVFTAHVVPIALVAVCIGALGLIVNVIIVSSRQRVIPAPLLGRVNAAFRLVTAGATPVGAALGGVTAAAFGLRGLFTVAVLGQLLAVGALQRPITDEALAPTAPTPV